ncbi:MAG: 30S ribosomal protein S20 [Clostridia bacterium]|nr:30S ribosomal protein S20 [Clostridia bacterium]
MANIKSAKKRILVTDKKTAHNKSVKSALKTELKKFDAALASEDADREAAFRAAVSKVDASASKGIIHKNKANRKKAQLAKKLNSALSE